MRTKITNGCIALGVRQLISLPINAIGLGIASVFLSPTDFGVQAVISILTSLALVVIDLGTTSALVQCKNPPPLRLMRQVQKQKNIAGISSILIYVLLSPSITSFYNLPKWMAVLFPFCGVIGWLQSQRGYQSIWLQRKVEWEKLAKADMIEIVGYNAVLVISVFVFRSPAAFILSLGIRMAMGAIILRGFSKNIGRDIESSDQGIRAILGFGIPYQATTILSMIQKSMNPIIVGSLAGVRGVGFVNWSSYIVSIPLLPIQPIYALLFSVISERQRQGRDDREIIEGFIRLGTIMMSLLTLVSILILPKLVIRILGKQWIEALPVASVLLLGNVAAFPGSIITTHLAANGYSKKWLQIVFVESALMWILGGLGTFIFGLIGYAYGLLGACLIVLSIECSVAKKLTNLKVSVTTSIRLIIMVTLCIIIGQKSAVILSMRNGWAEASGAIIAVILFLIILLISEYNHIKKDSAVVYMVIKNRPRVT